MKTRLFKFAFIAVVFFFASCVKATKDLVEDIDQRTRCVDLLSDFTTSGEDKTCAQQITDIDNILRDCGEFMTQDQKDELNTAKENCSDN